MFITGFVTALVVVAVVWVAGIVVPVWKSNRQLDRIAKEMKGEG